ncbi:MAG TPA: amylo-alpha-1,6-glucosidase, partial [Spirochaetia bacterium]|nr:amylo-alpha-1,6-glucosidase [Spirochaetia bacterium]
ESFGSDPWPTWNYRLNKELRVRQEIFTVHGAGITVARFTLVDPVPSVRLLVRPFLSGRDYHSTHHENGAFGFDPDINGEQIRFSPYDGIPDILLMSNGAYRHDPLWYRQFLYVEEQSRGLDCVEDLAAPGELRFDLSSGQAVVILASTLSIEAQAFVGSSVHYAASLAERELVRRRRFATPLHRSADQYLVQRSSGKSIIAGYPWFTDWGRDTFISLRGLCLSTGRLRDAEEILRQWASVTSEGMLPNFFADDTASLRFNSVDASLWYIIAVDALFSRLRTQGLTLDGSSADLLWKAADQILSGYISGTRYHIQVDPSDGLLRAGEPGVQLTWMDAKINDRIVTRRSGKPVEVEALWINALSIGARRSAAFGTLFRKALDSFVERFWNEKTGCLFDVIDVDHRAGAMDASLRPNQILAIGGLPVQLLFGERARRVVDCCESLLLTPNGLRSLAPGEPGYAAHYEGDAGSRDGAYHQGTVWPWLLGPFVEAWVRVRDQTPIAKAEGYRRFVAPIEDGIWSSGGIGHVSEIADAEAPFTLRGCPFQAWSTGELLRLKLDVLKEIREPETEGGIQIER